MAKLHKAMYYRNTQAYLGKGELVCVELGVTEVRLFLLPASSSVTT